MFEKTRMPFPSDGVFAAAAVVDAKASYCLACEQRTHFRSSLSYFSEGEKRRPEMRLLFAGYLLLSKTRLTIGLS